MQRPAGSIIAIAGRNAMQRETAEEPRRCQAQRRAMPVPPNRVRATDAAASGPPDDRNTQQPRSVGTGRTGLRPAGVASPRQAASTQSARSWRNQKPSDATPCNVRAPRTKHPPACVVPHQANRPHPASAMVAQANTSDAMPCNVRTTRTKHPPACVVPHQANRPHPASAMAAEANTSDAMPCNVRTAHPSQQPAGVVPHQASRPHPASAKAAKPNTQDAMPCNVRTAAQPRSTQPATKARHTPRPGRPSPHAPAPVCMNRPALPSVTRPEGRPQSLRCADPFGASGIDPAPRPGSAAVMPYMHRTGPTLLSLRHSTASMRSAWWLRRGQSPQPRRGPRSGGIEAGPATGRHSPVPPTAAPRPSFHAPAPTPPGTPDAFLGTQCHAT